ncbi:hypothetical protein V493_07395 [Pseudogymnoascus sp. VKM F-4281 (FW-2241)]|nr:hypothetical protein V493_07395 [Pseudogymnoascus sp. VKM F-4281 (FW-2241)]
MPSLKKWLRKMSLSRSKATTLTKDDVPFGKGDVLPFLPFERPRILTPSPSREDLISPMVSYGFFQNLPYEIRRNILIEAFGGRTLHMDLSYNHLHHPEPDFNYESNQARGTELHKGWQWFSCVCHRPVEWLEDSPCRNSPFPILARWGFEKPKAKPSEDNCLRGDSNRVEYGPMRKEDQLSECFIGVMGWLLTCRQASRAFEALSKLAAPTAATWCPVSGNAVLFNIQAN